MEEKSSHSLKFCSYCGHVGGGKIGGSVWLTLLLIFLYIIPGIAYEIWRRTEKYQVCEKCFHRGLMTADSPIAKQKIKQINSE